MVDSQLTRGAVLFVGVGAMGAPMASHLVAAGVKVTVADADSDRAREVADQLGVSSAPVRSTPEADVVILMLPDSVAVQQVLLGDGGLLERLRPGSTVVDMSSSRPASTVELAERASQRGIALVDAPVSGGVARARTGELSIMVGAHDGQADTVLPLLETMGSDVVHVGPPGAGHAMKALNNLLSAIGLVGASEVLSIGANFGLEPTVMLDVLNRSTGRNHATDVKMARFVLSRAFDSGFSLALMVKDLRTALDLAHETGTPTPLGAAALEEWTAALGARAPGADHTEIAAYVEDRAKTELT